MTRAGHDSIPAVVYDLKGIELGECELPLAELLSSRESIPRRSRADELRWKRAVEGAKLWPLPFPSIMVVPGQRGWNLTDVTFDWGDSP